MMGRQASRMSERGLLAVGVLCVVVLLGCATPSVVGSNSVSSPVGESATDAATSAAPTAVVDLSAGSSASSGASPNVTPSSRDTASSLSAIPSRHLKVRIDNSPKYKVLPPMRGAYSGVFAPPSPFDMSHLGSYNRKFGKPPAVVMWYQPWTPNEAYGQFKKAEIEALLRRGIIPMITWEPWNPPAVTQPAYQLKDVIDGRYDSYIRSWARGAKSVNGPIMLRPFHEMNGYWYPWSGTVNGNSPAEFKKAWIHVHDIFREEGVTNVTWVWSINWKSSPDVFANRYHAYYPGDDYVDWTSISGFNWGKTRTRPQGDSFTKLYSKPIAYLTKRKKPIIISEIACNTGVDKPAWIRDSYTRIRTQYPQVKGIVYYDNPEKNAKGTQRWHISSSASSSRAYDSMISSRWFVRSSTKSLIGATGTRP
jgi:mannan endo-1,4-beta-mannosidase